MPPPPARHVAEKPPPPAAAPKAVDAFTADRSARLNALLIANGETRRAKSISAAEQVLSSIGPKTTLREVTLSLRGADPETFKRVVEGLAKDGRLDAMMGKATRGERESFVAIGARSGYLRAVESKRPNAPFDPPRLGSIVARETQPRALNAAIAERNETLKSEYRAAYDGYLGRYIAAAKTAPDIRSLRSMGPPVTPLTSTDGKYSENQAAVAVSERKNKLLGRTSPGEISGKIEVGFWLLNDGKKVVGLGGEAKFDGQGTQLKGSAHAARGPLSTDGKSATFEHETKGKSSVEVKVTENGGSVGVNGTGIAVEGDEVTFSYGVKEENVTARGYVGSNGRDTVKVGGEVGGKVPLWGKNELEARAGGELGLKGIDRETTEAFADQDSPGFHAKPPELTAGKSWEQLSDARRKRFEFLGWSKQEWSQALAER